MHILHIIIYNIFIIFSVDLNLISTNSTPYEIGTVKWPPVTFYSLL